VEEVVHPGSTSTAYGLDVIDLKQTLGIASFVSAFPPGVLLNSMMNISEKADRIEMALSRCQSHGTIALAPAEN
jgi:hypothetical protein